MTNHGNNLVEQRKSVFTYFQMYRVNLSVYPFIWSALESVERQAVTSFSNLIQKG